VARALTLRNNRRVAARFETWARLDIGDHGMGVQRDDPQRVGLIEVTDELRWVPREGADWAVPLADVVVLTPLRWPNRPSDGVELEIPAQGRVRIRAMSHPPGVPLAAAQAYTGQSARSGKLLKELVRRGAQHRPTE